MCKGLERLNVFAGLQYYIIRPFCPKYGVSIFSCNNILSISATLPG
jgi:hypothetical protein